MEGGSSVVTQVFINCTAAWELGSSRSSMEKKMKASESLEIRDIGTATPMIANVRTWMPIRKNSFRMLQQ